MSLVKRAPWIGPAIQSPNSDGQEPDILGDLAELHDLCALNSWVGHQETTCQTMHGGSSFIDVLWTRRAQADSQSRTSHALKTCPLLACQSACYHYPLSGSIPKIWKCWARASTEVSHLPRIDVDSLLAGARSQSSTWLTLTHCVQEALASYTVQQMSDVTSKVRQLCCQYFPMHPAQKTSLHEESGLRDLRSDKWRLWRELNKPCGCSLHSIFLRWWMVIRIRFLSKISSKRSRCLRRDRLNQVYADATEAASRNNIRNLFRHVRRLAPKKARVKMSLRDSSGHLLGPVEEGKHLYEHFRKVFHDDMALTLGSFHM